MSNFTDKPASEIRTAVIISNIEMETLNDESLPHEPRILYLLCIRPFMDYATGIAGFKRRLSYQMFSERMFIARRRGSTIPDFEPTKEELRTMIKHLARVGLIVKFQNKKIAAPMVFRLPLAVSDVSYLYEEQHDSNTLAEADENQVVSSGSDAYCNTCSAQQEKHTSAQSTSSTTKVENQNNTGALITKGWLPSETTKDILIKRNIPEVFIISCIDEFVQYWLERSVGRHSWNSSFIANVLHHWSEELKRKTKTSRNEKKKSVSGSKPKKQIDWNDETWADDLI